MKALSVRQPWAWLIVNGYKDVENRTRHTRIRGRVFIHASKTFDHLGYKAVQILFPDLKMPFWNGWVNEFPMGGLVGSVEIADSTQDFNSAWKVPGSIGYVLRDPLTMPFTPMRGALGFFTVNDEGIPNHGR